MFGPCDIFHTIFHTIFHIQMLSCSLWELNELRGPGGRPGPMGEARRTRACRNRKDWPDLGSNPGLRKSSNGTITTTLSSKLLVESLILIKNKAIGLRLRRCAPTHPPTPNVVLHSLLSVLPHTDDAETGTHSRRIATSDTALRVGPTPKHCDVDNLLTSPAWAFGVRHSVTPTPLFSTVA
jgi:hypothetical protein